jgi:MFS family permease
VLWTATVVANIGSWMYSAASGWLMTSLNPSPLLVSLVQAATTLPMFLFALPAGALADILDRRRLLIAAEIAATVVSAIFALMVSLRLAAPANLLLFVFLIGVASALTAPAWQAIVPQLVPRRDLQAAVAANSAGFNVSRAIGPALGGVIIATIGIAAPFWLNALSNFGIIGALIWWRPRTEGDRNLPPERFVGALRAGFRYAANSSALRASLIRGAAFFVFASAYWALLPLLARNQIGGGPGLYGFLLGTIGAGAVGGAFALPWLKAKLGSEVLMASGSAGTALSMILFGLARDPGIALLASVLAGVGWIAVLATLNVSAQIALPEWVRGRGLSIYGTVMFGSLTLGSALWGAIAGLAGIATALLIAAVGLLLPIPLLQRWPPWIPRVCKKSGAFGEIRPSWPHSMRPSMQNSERMGQFSPRELRNCPTRCGQGLPHGQEGVRRVRTRDGKASVRAGNPGTGPRLDWRFHFSRHILIATRP